MLSTLPGIQMSHKKEVHYFDNETRTNWSDPNPLPLHIHFDWTVQNVLRGEATPITCFWPLALGRLKAYNPDARLILLLRHPVHRAYSQWKMERLRGKETLSFADAMSDLGRARAQGRPHRIYSYVERGFFATILENMLRLFPVEQLHIIRTDRLWSAPEAELERVMNFLGNPVAIELIRGTEYTVPHDTRQFGGADDEQIERYLPLFTEELARLQVMTGIDFTDWLSAEYAENILPNPAA